MQRFALMVASLAMASTAFAQSSGKISTVWNCAAPNPSHALPVGDTPDHVYVVEQSKCTATSGEIAGLKQKEGTATEFLEGTSPTASKGHGVFVETLSSGDKIFYSYDTTGTSKGGVLVSGSNKWTITEGTGKFKGVKGSGACTGKGNPDKTANFTCTGTYSLAK